MQIHPGMRSEVIALIVGVSLTATGCATKSGTGTAVGAGAGGALGYAVGGVGGLVVGGLIGGALGYTVGKSMEEEDRRRAAYALETNRAQAWHNPETGYDYRVEPTKTVYENGRECREFRVLAEVDGQPDQVEGTACRTPDGRWEAISG
jgi:surface antigen